MNLWLRQNIRRSSRHDSGGGSCPPFASAARAALPIFWAVFFLTLAACSGPAIMAESAPPAELTPDQEAPAAPTAPPVSELVVRQTGTAAWYGQEYHGRPTAGGDVFDMNAFFASHRTLPLGSRVRVTNLGNGKSLEVRITHRGPWIKSRIMDLSYGAARELGFLAEGSAQVSIESPADDIGQAFYTILAATYLEEENAGILKERLAKRFEVIAVIPVETGIARFWQVQAGSYASIERAERIAEKLKLEGLEPVILRKD